MIYRVEFTSSDQREFNDCWRECEALSAAEFMLKRLPDYLLPARILIRGTGEVVAERRAA